jgi:hypothetical protein
MPDRFGISVHISANNPDRPWSTALPIMKIVCRINGQSILIKMNAQTVYGLDTPTINPNTLNHVISEFARGP